jgi:hypothetical protein
MNIWVTLHWVNLICSASFSPSVCLLEPSTNVATERPFERTQVYTYRAAVLRIGLGMKSGKLSVTCLAGDNLWHTILHISKQLARHYILPSGPQPVSRYFNSKTVTGYCHISRHRKLSHSHFVFGRSRAWILARRPAILTEIFHGFLQSLQANAGIS